MSPLLRAHLDVPRCEHGISILDDCAPCDERYSAEVADIARTRLSPWNAAAQSLRDAAARISALPGDTSLALMHLQEAQEALDDWSAPGELSEADVREWERDEPLTRYPLVAALEAAARGTR